ncbi:hypothetical protein [Streptomyces globosus]|uniref:hypothetical protein n=1 Tax=Streptomyces globosus TaxID=68209 RepID=UPI0013B455A1|nr:hypothetical protein [Streptomyces globosus]
MHSRRPPTDRATALAPALIPQRWLERCNLAVACTSPAMHLTAGGTRTDPSRARLTALACELQDPARRSAASPAS